MRNSELRNYILSLPILFAIGACGDQQEPAATPVNAPETVWGRERVNILNKPNVFCYFKKGASVVRIEEAEDNKIIGEYHVASQERARMKENTRYDIGGYIGGSDEVEPECKDGTRFITNQQNYAGVTNKGGFGEKSYDKSHAVELWKEEVYIRDTSAGGRFGEGQHCFIDTIGGWLKYSDKSYIKSDPLHAGRVVYDDYSIDYETPYTECRAGTIVNPNDIPQHILQEMLKRGE